MEKIRQTIKKAISERIFSAAAIEVRHKGQEIISIYEGNTLFPDYEAKNSEVEPEQITQAHMFDLASLTKPLCTSLMTAILIDKGALSLGTRVSDVFDEYSLSYNSQLGNITIAQLLNHSSGLDAWIDIHKLVKNRSEAYMLLRSRNLNYTAGTKHLYSDLGYIMLGELLEVLSEHKIDYLFEHFVTSPLELHDLSYIPVDSALKDEKKFVPSGFSQIRDRLLVGEVNDENTFIMGGVAGHAGLFGTASDVCALGQHILDTVEGKTQEPSLLTRQTLMSMIDRPSDGSEWACGWHYPSRENSTGGKRLSANSVGMTGFTGTSIWIDMDNSIVITLLTNRTMAPDASRFGSMADRFTPFRPMIHDMIMGEII